MQCPGLFFLSGPSLIFLSRLWAPQLPSSPGYKFTVFLDFRAPSHEILHLGPQKSSPYLWESSRLCPFGLGACYLWRGGWCFRPGTWTWSPRRGWHISMVTDHQILGTAKALFWLNLPVPVFSLRTTSSSHLQSQAAHWPWTQWAIHLALKAFLQGVLNPQVLWGEM